MKSLLENSINDVIKKYKSLFLKKENVIGIGMGFKTIKGLDTQELSLHVLVEKKLPLNKLYIHQIIPKDFFGIKTDVIESGVFKFFPNTITYEKGNINFETFKRPLQAGYSIAPAGENYSGTLGAIVFDNIKNEPYILSNNHILANRNTLKKGTNILQPSALYYGNYQKSIVGSLSKFIHMYFDDFSENLSDAAIAKILLKEYNTDIPYIGKILGKKEALINMNIKKTGSSSGYTKGVIKTVNFSIELPLPDKKTNSLYDQIISNIKSEPGDSGSIVVNEQNYAIGLLLGGAENYSIINPIEPILDELNIHF